MFPCRFASSVQLRARLKYRTDVPLYRYLRSSSRHRTLVGPPDPVSNLRPVIYDDFENVLPARRRGVKEKDNDTDGAQSSTSVVEQTRTSPTHPYLLDEFAGDPVDYQWRVERSRLDAFNHAFWKDSNERFDQAKHAVLSSLPESAPPEAQEAALSEFYAKWLKQEQDRLKEYSDEWNRRNFGGILLAARAAIRQFRSSVFGYKNSHPGSSHRQPSESNNKQRH